MIKNISKINLMVSLKRSKGNYGPGDPPVPFQLKKYSILTLQQLVKLLINYILLKHILTLALIYAIITT